MSSDSRHRENEGTLTEMEFPVADKWWCQRTQANLVKHSFQIP